MTLTSGIQVLSMKSMELNLKFNQVYAANLNMDPLFNCIQALDLNPNFSILFFWVVGVLFLS